MSAENYYEILGISPGAHDDEVKQAFRDLAKSNHPDYNPGDMEAERRFKLANTAYEALKDAPRRQSYDEWLGTEKRRENAKGKQWRRLVALLFLLFVGPSAVLYGVIMSGGTSVFPSSKEASDPPSAVEANRDGAKPHKERSSKLDQQVRSETTEDSQNSDRKGKAKPDRVASPARDQSKPAYKSGKPAEKRVGTDVTDRKPAAGGPESATTLEENLRADERPGEIKASKSGVPDSSPIKNSELRQLEKFSPQPPKVEEPPVRERSTSEPLYTNTVPQKPEPEILVEAKPARRDTGANRLSDRNAAGKQRVDDDLRTDAGTRASARLLAELKEPEIKAPLSRPPSPAPGKQLAERQPADEYAERFSDCGLCPLMSVAKREASTAGEASLAISLSEITIAQWNLCVEDGVCPPYRNAEANSSAPVTGLSIQKAEYYSGWLSGMTGESYRVVMPFEPSGAKQERSAANAEDCEPYSARRQLRGWDWLDDKPRRNCDTSPASQDAGDDRRGFRVARELHSNG